MVRFATKHAVAAIVVTAGIVGFTSAGYFVLWLSSFLSSEDTGGPFALPFFMVVALLGSLASVLFVLFPSTAVTEWICRKGQYRTFTQIPVAVILMVGVVAGLSVLIAVELGVPASGLLQADTLACGVLLIPLCAYWWSIQSTERLVSIGTRYAHRFRRSE
jgi:hypothetical protein